jgi:hypothetical protein
VIKLPIVLLGVLMIFISFRQIFLMFGDGYFRARGNRLIRRTVPSSRQPHVSPRLSA